MSTALFPQMPHKSDDSPRNAPLAVPRSWAGVYTYSRWPRHLSSAS
jgi:hypothetical protein